MPEPLYTYYDRSLRHRVKRYPPGASGLERDEIILDGEVDDEEADAIGRPD